jgi:putative restriction endonuclease
MLVASHIVPWADDSQNRLNPHNGLLLCRTHDSAFECGLIRIKPDGEVIVAISDPRQLGKDLHDCLQRTHHKLRAVSARFAPASEFLQWRFSHAKA